MNAQIRSIRYEIAYRKAWVKSRIDEGWRPPARPSERQKRPDERWEAIKAALTDEWQFAAEISAACGLNSNAVGNLLSRRHARCGVERRLSDRGWGNGKSTWQYRWARD